jgi:hypothetical protein
VSKSAQGSAPLPPVLGEDATLSMRQAGSAGLDLLHMFRTEGFDKVD